MSEAAAQKGEPILETSEQIRLLKEFIEQNYHAQLLETARKGKQSLVVDFKELIKFNTDLIDELIERPEEVLKAGEIAIKEFDLPKKVDKFNLRIKNLPESLRIKISEIRSKHLNKFIWAVGIVRQKSDVRPHVATAKFECPSCGNILSVLQLDTKYKEPTRCSCGRKGKFREISKELLDGQGLVLEESPDDLDGSQPKRINVFLKGDLVSPITERKSSPGTKVRLVGWVSEVPITLRSGGQSTKFDLILEANHIEPVADDPNEMKISEKDLKEIKKITNRSNAHLYVAQNLAPSIYGHDKIKESLVLQLVGGCQKVRPDGVKTRGDLHMLLIGDPGAGKCLVGDTKIVLESGEICTIKEYVESGSLQKIASTNLNGKSFNSQTTRFWKRKSPTELLKIKTSSGNEIICTKEHPLFTSQDAFTFAKKAQDFVIGDYLASPLKINSKGSLQAIDYNVFPSKSHNKVVFSKPAYCDEAFARLLGYLIGDGYVRKRNTTGIISFTNTDKVLLLDFECLIKDLFGLNVSKRSKIGKANHKECFEYYISSIELVRVLEKIDTNILSSSLEQKVPSIISKSPNTIIKEFLQVLFDCEGHINKHKREIEISSKSKELLSDVKLLLLRFGILSQLSSSLKCATNTKSKTKRMYHRLLISGEDCLLFAKHIGFGSKTKKQKLQNLVSSPKEINTNLRIVPNLSRVLKVLRQRYGLKQKDFGIPRSSYQHYERGDRNPSFRQLKLIGQTYHALQTINIAAKEDLLIKILLEAANSDLFYDKIVSIKTVSSKEEYVYDLEIDTVHNFVANGVVAHNSQLLKRISRIAPKARFTSGKGASAAGLTASVVKDEFLGGWSLEAGTLVLANHGFAIIDELDKMTKEDRSALHEAMEQQTVSVSKANIQATLRCETSLLAAANPKFGRFDPYDLVANQINLPPTLINRFDLIFAIKDMPSREKDEHLAGFVLSLHKNPQIASGEIETDILKKYLLYVRKHGNPELTDEAIDEIKKYYVSMRNSGGDDEAGVKSIPITARQLEALVRLAEASAKCRMAKKVLKKDAQKAIELVNYSLNQIAKDSETGKIDIDRISSRITATQRSKISIIKEIISTIESETGQKIIPIELIHERAKDKNVPEEEVDKTLEKLRRSGDIFEPKRGHIQKL